MKTQKDEPADRFKAPWGRLLIVISSIAAIALVGIPCLSIIFDAAGNASEPIIIFLIPLIILFAAIPFLIRGYVITENRLIVQRLFWNNMIDLSKFTSAEANPKAMSKSIRTFGNGGLFSFSGKFRNKALGPYRAFATKLENSVVLKFTDHTIVVTPEQPQLFIQKIKAAKKI